MILHPGNRVRYTLRHQARHAGQRWAIFHGTVERVSHLNTNVYLVEWDDGLRLYTFAGDMEHVISPR